ncbi:Protein of unknown function (DUF2993) [Antricoccus suffuscus]|uniref:DUF2993 family protein n=1 Tax=Antricoccus suffuscus TaxID=1629062 RepID=A0A2T0YYN7_9ACTN|nr:DUF2993 domain-containing protein [Antricoccus suffuscus]PRZ29211.1 Protein of unknown function (DUF2993) [Antricoccus suffuscus]
MKTLKVVGVLVVLLLIIAVIIDRVGVAVAESKIADVLQSKFDLTSSPNVDIHGFPVITQAIAGKYKSIDVTAKDVPVESLGSVDVAVNLRGLRLTLSDAIAGRMQDATADDLHARVTMSDDAIGKALGMKVKIGKLDSSTARLSISTTQAGITIPMEADVKVAVDGNNVALKLTQLKALKVPIPDFISSRIGNVLSSKLVLPKLTGGLKVTDVVVGNGSITAVAEGHDVPLGG